MLASVIPAVARRETERRARARRVAELLDQGYSRAQIAQELGVSGPRISQIIHGDLPQYRADLGPTSWSRVTPRLYQYCAALRELRRDTLGLAAQVRRELRALEQELESANVDHILGLR